MDANEDMKSGSPDSQEESQSLTKSIKNDLEKGQNLFDGSATETATLSLEEQRWIRRYLYLLMLQITGSLILEMISYMMAEYWWVKVAVGVAYICNSVKLYSVMLCLSSMHRFHSCCAFLLLVWIGPWISLFVFLYDIIYHYVNEKKLANNTDMVHHQYIEHFHKSRVSIAALTAICGIFDGIGGILTHEHHWIGWVLGIYGLICCLHGLSTLWKLRHHPDFTTRRIFCAPCTLWLGIDAEYERIGAPKEDPKDKQEEEQESPDRHS